MDLGATICTPQPPGLRALSAGWSPARPAAPARQETFPRKAPKAARPPAPRRRLRADAAGRQVLVRTRPDKGLLGGMAEVPTSAWRADFDLAKAADATRRSRRAGGGLPAWSRHVFTHFPLALTVFAADALVTTRAPAGMPLGDRWPNSTRRRCRP